MYSSLLPMVLAGPVFFSLLPMIRKFRTDARSCQQLFEIYFKQLRFTRVDHSSHDVAQPQQKERPPGTPDCAMNGQSAPGELREITGDSRHYWT